MSLGSSEHVYNGEVRDSDQRLVVTSARFSGGKIQSAVSISNSGDNTIWTPAAGKFIRLYWLGMSASENNSAEVLATAKFGSNVAYLWNLGRPGAFSHWEVVDGAVNQPLVVNLSGAQPVLVNFTIEER